MLNLNITTKMVYVFMYKPIHQPKDFIIRFNTFNVFMN
jgi:hypothetical protein